MPCGTGGGGLSTCRRSISFDNRGAAEGALRCALPVDRQPREALTTRAWRCTQGRRKSAARSERGPPEMGNQAEIRIGDGSLRVRARGVYPNQGICRITGVDVKQIAGQQLEFVSLAREEDGATVMVPSAKVMGIGLRKVANVDAIDEGFDYLASPSDDPQLDWKDRHRENADKMPGGGLFGTVELLKGLHALSRVRPLPQKERELYDSARHLIVGEIAAAMGIPVGVAENNLDYALFPPPGMKRKGKELLPAAIPATAGAVRRGDGDDDLGFDDEAAAENGASEGEAAPKAAAGPAAAAARG